MIKGEPCRLAGICRFDFAVFEVEQLAGQQSAEHTADAVGDERQADGDLGQIVVPFEECGKAGDGDLPASV